MIRIFLIAISLLLAPCLSLAAPPQAELLTQRMMELLPRDARWGVTVMDLKSGKEIVNAGNTDELLSPASLVKLITAGAALDLELDKKSVSLATEVLHDGKVEDGTLNGNIYLRGNGNCLLSADDLRKVARTLKVKGIQRVTGRIVAGENRFDTRGLERSRNGAGHAPAGALGLDLHTVSVVVTPSEPGKPPVVSVVPPNASVRFAVAARTISGGGSSIAVTQTDDNGYRVSGDIPLDSAPLHQRFPLNDPALFATQSFRTILVEAGIETRGEAGKGMTPADAIALATIPGPAMVRLVREMNINSLNVAADNLLLTLGAASEGSPGTREKGLKAVREHLIHNGISVDETTIEDGSGLLPGNRVTPRAMTRYLAAIAKRPWFASFRESLPRAGMDGTLRNGGFRNERFRAKSGALENVAALAGYGVDKSGREIAFAFILNTPGPLPPDGRSAGDEVMRYLAE